MKDKIIIGNMKMNLTLNDINYYLENIKGIRYDKLVLCPTNIYIPYFLNHNIKVGIQNVFYKDMGSFTGEVSAYQASSLGINYAIVGHSERRNIFNETNEDINKKLKHILENNLTPILCIGEKKDEDMKVVLEKDINEALKDISNIDKIIIAYEPVWAIGTNIIPTNEKIEDTIKFIKDYIKEKFNCDILVLYGGSININNIELLNKINNVDGFLIGGASLKVDEFTQIIKCIIN